MKQTYLPYLFALPSLVSCGRWHHYCKPRPGDLGWPSTGQWNALNQSVNGQLSVPVPLGAACHPDRPQFNNVTCNMVAAQWSNTTFQAQNAVSADYNDETCLPSAAAPCSNDGYPEYVVSARNGQDVQEVVKFAASTGVRLVIKGTGHDFPGRSSGADSLSVYTHGIRGLEVRHCDPRATALGGVASMKIHAGEQMYGIYQFAAKEGVVIIGGADPDVGIGGWVLGGGHGPISAKYGLGADQMLEAEVVTADGELRTVNAECEPDLFWALRGGGPSTFAVLISVTVKAYAKIPASEAIYSYKTTSDSESFWSLAAYFHTKLPSLAERGVSGYYYVVPEDTTETNKSWKGKVYGVWIGADLSAETLRSIVEPLETEIRDAQWGDPVYAGSTIISTPDYMSYYAKNVGPGGEAGGFSARLGSRLLGNQSLLGDVDVLKAALRKTTPAPWMLLGHVVAPAPNSNRPTGGIAGGSNSVLPAWRKSYTHIVLPRIWPALNRTALTKVTADLRDVRVQALRDIEPDSGAYMNEADPTEPNNWQKTKFGENYHRLLEIKRRWDRKGVFWCKQCVGSELWTANGEFGIENGVGQNKVQLCRQWRHRGRGEGMETL